MRVMFVFSPRYYWPFVSEGDNYLVPQALVYLGAAVRAAGHEVSIYDCMPLKMGWQSLEARLRVVRDRSAEHLPDNAAGLEVMARRLTYRGTDALTAGEQLLADYERHTSEIREIFIRVLGGPPGPSEGQRR